jgi:hypothetical protein
MQPLQSPPHAQNDVSNLFSHLHSQRDRINYQEVKQYASALEILEKWPLLDEIHRRVPEANRQEGTY